MATKHDDACLAKAGDDEPIFVLRAQDKFAPLLVKLWAEVAEALLGEEHEKIIEARRCAFEMKVWADQTGRAKFPD